LETNINLTIQLPDLYKSWEKSYPYPKKDKATIIRIWKCLPSVLCSQIWLARNKSIFKDQNPRIGKILSETWILIFESLNSKEMTVVDQNNLQQEERDWYGNIISENKGTTGPKKSLTSKN